MLYDMIHVGGDLFETLYGYKFSGVVDRDEWAVHDGPTQLGSDHDLLDFICQHVLTAPEIRITDRDDCLVMHIVEQELIFPLTGTNAVRGHVLVWDNERKQFKPGKSKA